MSDKVDQGTRSRMMAGIRAKNTKPEMVVRRALHRRGFRYRINVHTLPGTPDIVLPRYRAAIFVHGCFWHRHEGCRLTAVPKTRAEFWLNKFQANVARDAAVILALRNAGWRTSVVWECATRAFTADLQKRLEDWIVSDGAYLDLGADTLSNEQSVP